MPATRHEAQFLPVGSAAQQRRIAYLKDGAEGTAPGLIWLCGFRSEMTSIKASALATWAEAHHRPCLRFDYSGHGQSSGRSSTAPSATGSKRRSPCSTT